VNGKKKILGSVGATFGKKVITWQLMWYLPLKLSDVEWNSVDLACWVLKAVLHCTYAIMSSKTSTIMLGGWRRHLKNFRAFLKTSSQTT